MYIYVQCDTVLYTGVIIDHVLLSIVNYSKSAEATQDSLLKPNHIKGFYFILLKKINNVLLQDKNFHNVYSLPACVH